MKIEIKDNVLFFDKKSKSKKVVKTKGIDLSVAINRCMEITEETDNETVFHYNLDTKKSITHIWIGDKDGVNMRELGDPKSAHIFRSGNYGSFHTHPTDLPCVLSLEDAFCEFMPRIHVLGSPRTNTISMIKVKDLLYIRPKMKIVSDKICEIWFKKMESVKIDENDAMAIHKLADEYSDCILEDASKKFNQLFKYKYKWYKWKSKKPNEIKMRNNAFGSIWK
jgi:hypothetical protein